MEKKAFQHLVRASSQWASAKDLHEIGDWGFVRGFVDMEKRRQAAQLRVFCMEASSTGGLHIARRARRLREALRHSVRDDEEVIWASWFDHSF